MNKQIQERLYHGLLAQIATRPEWLDHPALVVSVENGHEGVIGIVAGKLAERFYKPTLCVTTDGEVAKGSGRASKREAGAARRWWRSGADRRLTNGPWDVPGRCW